jgi:hypothetical protein
MSNFSESPEYVRAKRCLVNSIKDLEDITANIREILNDNQIMHDNPVKFFSAIKDFREQVRLVDTPSDMSFIVNGKNKTIDPGCVQRVEAFLIESAYHAYHRGDGGMTIEEV